MAWDGTALAHVTTGDLATASTQNKVLDDIALVKTNINDDGTFKRYPMQGTRGMHLRTDPGNILGLTNVSLLALDEVMMDDGMRYSGLTLPLSASISASGAGGLDTGSATGDRWYEIYLIGKNTRAASDVKLLFHLAERRPVDASQTTDNANDKLRQGASDRVKLAQGFKTTVSGAVSVMDVKLTRVGTLAGGPTKNLTFTIQSDNAGNPSGTILASADVLDATGISTTAQVVRLIFRTPATLTATTQYHLVMEGDYTASAVNYVQWQGDSSNSYAGGSGRKFDGTSWAASATIGDFYFAVYPTVSSSVTMPSNYDEKCRVGFVYYDSATPAFQPFVQKDRVYVPLSSRGPASFTNTIPTLVDLTAHIPPGQMAVRWALGGSNSAGNVVTLGAAAEGFGITATPGVHGGKVGFPWSSITTPSVHVTLLTEFQSMYLMVNANTAQAYVDAVEYV